MPADRIFKKAHPPYCTCVQCANRRLSQIIIKEDKGYYIKKGSNMEFIRGFFSYVVTMVVSLLTVVFIIMGVVMNSPITIVLSLIIGCGIIFGIRYWLGKIVRIK